MNKGIMAHFSQLQDPRIERKKLHDLQDILTLVICGIIGGATGWKSIIEFAHEKESWYRQFIPLKNGIPSVDCISYVISRLSFKGFRECFISWTASVAEETSGQIISIDGKTARGSRDKKKDQSPLHMVSAWANSSQIVLAQEVTNKKSNEITAIPKLLDLLNLKECIVTIDAMGCQKEIAQKIIEKDGDYVFSLKGNQGTLHDSVTEFFDIAEQDNYANLNYKEKETIDKGHGRLEKRRYIICDNLETIANKDDWKGFKSIGMAERICYDGQVEKKEVRYFISSINVNAELFSKSVREHWGIENKLHWRLDVVFNEDNSRIRKGNAPEIMTTIRHLCMGIFDNDLCT